MIFLRVLQDLKFLAFSGLRPLKTASGAFTSAQDGPRGPQEGPKTVQERSKMAQDRPRPLRDGLRWPQDGPREAQDGPRGPQEDPQEAPRRQKKHFLLVFNVFRVLAVSGRERPNTVQERSKRASDGLSTAQEGPKTAQEALMRTPTREGGQKH